MRLSKTEKLRLRSEEFCKKFLRPDWDGCAANNYFTSRCDMNPSDKYYGKPAGAPFDGLIDIHVAQNNIYMRLCPAYEKSEVVKLLESIISSEVIIPKNVNSAEKYRCVYISTAEEILQNVIEQKYDFQKPVI